MRLDRFQANELTLTGLRSLSREQYDELAFGIIELDREFIVRNYNRPESLLARRSPEDTIGKHFFREVAPCTDNAEFRGRIEAIMRAESEQREARFEFEFRFPWGRREVIVRALRDEFGTCWVFVTPLRAASVDLA